MSNAPQASIQSTAFVIHKARFGNDSDTFSILAHDIHHTSSASMLGAGRPFGHEEKLALMSMLGDYRGSDLEFLDAKCLASSHETMMWYRPRQKTMLNIVGNDLTLMVPSLIFLLHKGHLYVAAYAGDRRPERDTKLLHCGLPNIQSHTGSWCSGGNHLPDRPNQSMIERLEGMFFLSPFTHWNPEYAPVAAADRAALNSVESMKEFFAGMQGKRNFPVSKLPSMGGTVTQWMDKITSMNARY